MPKTVSWLVTMFLVIFGWGIFMCDGIGIKAMIEFLSKLFFINGKVINPVTIGSLKLWGYLPFLIVGFFITTPIFVSGIRGKVVELKKKHDGLMGVVNDLYIIIVLLISLMFLIGGTYNPFIYFRF